MKKLRRFVFRLGGLLQRRRIEAEMTEEIRLHLEMQTEAHIAAGMKQDEAREAAQRDFGGIEQIKERYRDERLLVFLDQVAKEARGTLRSLWRTPKFTVPILSTLVLGIGAATLIFVLTGWITLRSLPFPDPQQICVLGTHNKQIATPHGLYAFQFEAYRQRTDIFSEFAGARRNWMNVLVGGQPIPAVTVQVSRDFFPMLGIVPALGRSFLPSEYSPGADGEVVITDLFWRRHFNGEPTAVGQTIVIDRKPCVVVGVLRVNQMLLDTNGDMFQPFSFRYDPTSPIEPFLRSFARLKPGISRSQARAALMASPPSEPKMTWPGAGAEPDLAKADDTFKSGGYWLILVAGAFLYAIACLNAANLILVRFSERRREWSIRLAIGGSRMDIVRLAVIECGILALVSAVAVAVIARELFPFLVVYYGRNEDSAYVSFWNLSTISCIGVLSAVALIAMTVMPVVSLSRQDVRRSLYEGSAAPRERPGTSRIRSALVVLQAGIAVLLIAGAGLMLQTFQRLEHVDLGFEPSGMAKIIMAFGRNDPNASREKRLQLLEDLRQRLLRLPGVIEASFGSDVLLMGGYFGGSQVRADDGSLIPVQMDNVSADFLKTARMALCEGKWVEDRPAIDGAVINQALAKAYFGKKDPVGQFLKLKGPLQDASVEVVGVVRDVRESLRAPVGMHLYVAAAAVPMGVSTFIVRLNRSPDAALDSLIHEAIYDLDPNVLPTVTSFDEVMGNQAFMERYASSVLIGLSSAALVLAAVGLFSALACTVERRMPEFGVRLTLGATPHEIMAMVVRRGLFLASAGIALGTAFALGLTRFMRSILFETAPYDPGVFVGTAFILLLVAGLACWTPARRAASSDVAALLRAE
jgi:predicted permease